MTFFAAFASPYATDNPATPAPTMHTSQVSSSTTFGPEGVPSIVPIQTETLRPLSVRMARVYHADDVRANGRNAAALPAASLCEPELKRRDGKDHRDRDVRDKRRPRALQHADE